MGAKGRTGERGSIEMTLIVSPTKVIQVGDASIVEFMMSISMFDIPSGTAKVLLNSDDTTSIKADVPGSVVFRNLDGSDDAVEFSIHVMSASLVATSDSDVYASISFSFGTRNIYANMANIAYNGTSVEMMRKLLDTVGLEYEDGITGSIVKPQDTQIWRVAEASILDNLNYVVDHSSCRGDYMYWCVNEKTGKIIISSIERERARSSEQLMVPSPVAASDSTHSVKTTTSPKCTCWAYMNYLPSDTGGDSIAAQAPNIMIDSFDSEGNKDMGSCSGSCWSSILDAYGVNHENTPETQTFGGKELVKPFPNNTYKSYSVAPIIRTAYIATYNKVIKTALINTIGPSVGSVVKLVARKPTIKKGDMAPDGYYTDEYVVMNKAILKNSSVKVGLIGNTVDSSTANISTVLTLSSNHMDSTEGSKLYKSIIDAQTKFGEAYGNG